MAPTLNPAAPLPPPSQVLDIKWKDEQLWGSIEVLPTPSGLLLWELYSSGIKLGVSSRCVCGGGIGFWS